MDNREDGDEDGDGLVGSADGGTVHESRGEVVVGGAATSLAGDTNGEYLLPRSSMWVNTLAASLHHSQPFLASSCHSSLFLSNSVDWYNIIVFCRCCITAVAGGGMASLAARF